jgi:folate-dependent phosphoribosylglycinamide formyltransferase PurN
VRNTDINLDKPIVLLCSDGDSTRAVYNALRDRFGSITVIVEPPLSRIEMAKRRTKRLGIGRVFGQILFVTFVVPILSRIGRERIEEIEAEHSLVKAWPPDDITYVDSVNSDSARTKLREIDPSVVVVNGTRIIGKETLRSVDCAFINTHAGITPLYRGVHGAYWALAEGRADLVGTTVHYVDEGIDTGNILKQVYFTVSEKDNFATYPYLHTGFGIPILLETIEKYLNDVRSLKAFSRDELPSKLRYHPTILQYFLFLIKRSTK